MPYKEEVDVALLLGINCARAIKPREIIPGNDNDPYAKRTANQTLSETKTEDCPLSYEDRSFMSKVSKGIHQRFDGHYKMPLPFKHNQ